VIVLGSYPLSAPPELRSWSWIAPDGKEVRGEQAELVLDLKTGALPPSTLVWQKGWLEWLPALRVAALASAFPDPPSEPPLEPKRSPLALVPPLRPSIPKLPQPATKGPAPAPAGKTADPSSFGTLGRPRGPSVLGPARSELAKNTAPPRTPMATLGDEPGEQRSTTLRPPGAIPPPPRQVPAPTFDLTPSRLRDDVEAPTRRHNPVPSQRDSVAEPHTPKSALPSELRPAVVLPPSGGPVQIVPAKAAPLPKPAAADLDSTLDSTPFEVTAQDFVELGPSGTAFETPAHGSDTKTQPPARRRRGGSRPSVGGIVLIATLVGLATFVIVKVVTRPRAEAQKKAALVPPPETAAPTLAAPAGCGIVQPASRLAASVHRPVAPLVTASAEGTRASIGFAEAENVAVGLSVDLVTLDADRVFREPGKNPVRFVVPRALDPKRFLVDRDDGATPAARSFDGDPGFSLGPSNGDWVRSAGRSTGVVWNDKATEKTTDPRVASSSSGHLVTFRSGGLSGKVLYGFLGPDGSPRGELGALDVPGVRLSGTPDPAISGNAWLIAFAGRATPEEEWHVVLASGKLDGGAPVVRAFTSPPGGAGGSSIAPTVSGLGDGSFVLQWTEGKTAEYQVRVQRLGPDLEPQGEATVVSPKGANAGQGAVFARAPKVLSLFVQTTAGHDELWGTSLECP
jgi:hypothetical protein